MNTAAGRVDVLTTLKMISLEHKCLILIGNNNISVSQVFYLFNKTEMVQILLQLSFKIYINLLLYHTVMLYCVKFCYMCYILYFFLLYCPVNHPVSPSGAPDLSLGTKHYPNKCYDADFLPLNVQILRINTFLSHRGADFRRHSKTTG